MSASIKTGFIVGFIYVFMSISNHASCDEHSIGSKFEAEKIQRKKCHYNLKVQWHTDIGSSPFASTPLIADVNGDGMLEVVAVPFSETITVLEGSSGKALPSSHWPLHNLDTTFHASPLQYDIDGNGVLDILLVSSSGEIMFYRHDGLMLNQFLYQLPKAYVLRYWHQRAITVPFEDITKYVSETGGPDHLGVDVHVFASPVLVDVNRDGVMEELVVPTTYMFVEEDYDLPPQNANKYLVGGISIVNLTALYESRIHHRNATVSASFYLELTQVLSDFPAFNLFSPTVVDLDGDGSELEVVVGLSTGSVHAFTPSVFRQAGTQRPSFPLSFNTVHGQVTVTDVDNDGRLELIAIDVSGNVLCFRGDGSTVWTSEISGSSSPGSRIADTNRDGILDVIVPTNEGDIYVLNGTNGALLPKWPVKTGKRVAANVLVTHFRTTRGPPDIVFVADDGSLYIIAGDHSCETHITLEESSLVEVLSHDLLPWRQGLELLVSTKDGSIICLGSVLENSVENLIEDSKRKNILFTAWPGSTKTANDFSFTDLKPQLYIAAKTRDQGEITGSSFLLEFEIADRSKPHQQQKYDLVVYYGRHMLGRQQYSKPGQYQLTVPTWSEPGTGHVTVVLTNQQGIVATDSMSFRFNQLILQDIQWLVLAPFLAMVIILLVSHGFPAKDLLPVTLPGKTK
ncbi:uncharacterized protein LOC143281614 [Babylonia areolata]|uniref:uncharacterized protein LOC143281614 n=1 Tax=Babylonia areolata TaxID=304850 RepID=UPI003FD1392C